MRRFNQGDRIVHVESRAELVYLEAVGAVDGFSKPILCAAKDRYGARVIADECDLELRPVGLRSRSANG